MENYEERILRKIQEDVNSNASLVKELVQSETDSLHDDQLSFYKEGLKKETDTYLEKELSELRLYAATKSSRDKMDTKKKLLALRQQLANSLFDEVRNKLQQFRSSADYATYLKSRLDDLQITDSGVFFCDKEDMKLLQSFLDEKGYTNPLEQTYMSLGGFKYRDETLGTEYTCSLEESLENEMEWFRNHSGFKLTESEENK